MDRILHIVIGLIFIFNSISDALAQDYRVVEIDSLEYYGSKCGFENESLFLEGADSHYIENNQLLYSVVAFDEEARDVYLYEIIDNDGFSHDFSCVNFDNTIIRFLQFCTPLKSFMYAAATQYNTPISISEVKIDSAPIVISKDGYIAGFRDNNDEFFTEFKIYKMAVDRSSHLDITELFSYSNHNNPWQISYKPFSVFWKNDTLYISGRRLEKSDDKEYIVSSCYFKTEPIDSQEQ